MLLSVPSHRRQMNAQLSDEAYTAWRWFAESQRVTVSALMEAIGDQLAHVDEVTPPKWLRDAVKAAALIDVDRRRRS